ncbi:NAD(P)/FAD-dependent oxidoreductase [Streptomyces sp. ISL-96]|uniref:FAD-dependent oxidoreductase n=1 Tax=Streptomyces sp. ISL-96 TaxID=2819191 RepID=UPI001BEB2EC7|nr:FAD-dependent oxidoreductase [Streptomyces sp. ISL-96]MBT2493596.1 NAD(P)/FAD-dependent oxidoreductase [Streptomyces sp. ISL-96]
MKRVVVIGNGMAGHRVAAEVHARRPDWDITVIGSEPYQAYNRILLTNLLAGRATADSIVLGEQPPVIRVVTGRRVTGIDRLRRTVFLESGSTVPYDRLVLATGGLPFLPPVKGLTHDDGRLHPHAVAFRTLDDCLRIVRLAKGRRRAVVVGGGLLGLEAARGLAQRGLDVHILHAADHLLERQIDATAASMLSRTLTGLGITTWTSAAAAKLLGEDRLTGVELTDGRRIPGDFLVVACGTRPDTELAVAAGLATGRGVLVDNWMRTNDPDVYAVGDCAEHRDTVYGLVGPAWEQARTAAGAITGSPDATPYEGSRLVTRLKAAGIDLAAMGDPSDPPPDDPDTEVLRFSDTGRGVYQKITLRDGRVTGAVLLGDTSTGGVVTRYFDRGAEVPRDRRLLLFPELADGDGAKDAAALPGEAVVCQCNGVTKDAILRCRKAGARDVAAVADHTRATTGCGGCRPLVEELLDCRSTRGA